MKLKKEIDAGLEAAINKLKNGGRLGIMGGTFDPPHYGHLAVAEAARTAHGLDAVLLLPAGVPSFKRDMAVTDAEHRFMMAFLAAGTNPFFFASRMETDREGITYTVDTISELKRLCPENTKLFFITGADAFRDVFKWREVEALFVMCGFIVATRYGVMPQEAAEEAQYRFGAEVHILQIPALDISSSDIRRRVAEGQPVKYLLPPEVEQYIHKYGLYATGLTKRLSDGIIKKIKETQSEKRLRHTFGVAETAKELAARFGEDKERAYAAGLLHDASKGFSNSEISEKIMEYSIEAGGTPIKNDEIAHGYVAAEMARREFGVSDEDILNAMKYHTTGRRGMCLLEKIIFVADFIEPSRGGDEWAAKARVLAHEDIDAAVIAVLEGKMAYVKAKNQEIHPLSIEALDFMEYHYMNGREDI